MKWAVHDDCKSEQESEVLGHMPSCQRIEGVCGGAGTESAELPQGHDVETTK